MFNKILLLLFIFISNPFNARASELSEARYHRKVSESWTRISDVYRSQFTALIDDIKYKRIAPSTEVLKKLVGLALGMANIVRQADKKDLRKAFVKDAVKAFISASKPQMENKSLLKLLKGVPALAVFSFLLDPDEPFAVQEFNGKTPNSPYSDEQWEKHRVTFSMTESTNPNAKTQGIGGRTSGAR